jgi:YHS domain-containing protein
MNSKSRFGPRYAALVLILFAVAGPPVEALAADSTSRLNKNGVALCSDRDSKTDDECFDPVSYVVDKRAAKVSLENAKKFRFQYNQATYVFSSQAHLDLFKENPAKYLPQFGGWCAYAVAANKEKVDVDPESFLIQDGRLLLFYNGFLADTRKTWTTDKKKDSKTYLTEADANWPSVEKKDP